MHPFLGFAIKQLIKLCHIIYAWLKSNSSGGRVSFCHIHSNLPAATQ
jgi:hypothetical protein